jgi:hypothetical protein
MSRCCNRNEVWPRVGCGVLIPLLAWLLAGLPCAADESSTNAAAAAVPSTNAAPAGAPWRFRIGPLFEIGRSQDGVDLLAVRPLFCRVSESRAQESITDAVWPVSSFHRRDDYFHWWVLPAFGKDESVQDPLSRHSLWVVPLYARGRTRAGDDFEALFPIGGSVRDLFGFDQLEFAFFPAYLHYETGAQATDSYLWPIYLHETGPLRERRRFFPVYGVTTTATERSTFTFWPFWSHQVFDGPRQHGTASMLFPVYGRVDTDAQQGWMAVPPLFSHMTFTNGDESLRCPWPIYESTRRRDSRRENLWPLWTHTQTPTGHRGTVAWPFWWEDFTETGGRREASETLVPFYHAARSEIRTGSNGVYAADLDYVRYWPVYSREETPAGTRIRVPEFTFLRDGQGIERNWAPFWSWYVQSGRGESVDHDVFWGLARWGRQCDHSLYGQVGPLADWRRRPGGRLEWSVLGGLLGAEGSGETARRRWFWFWTTERGNDEGAQR